MGMVWFFALATTWLACTSGPDTQDTRDDATVPTADTSTSTGDTATTVEAPLLDGWMVMPSSEAGLHTPFLAEHAPTGHLYATWGERGNDGFTRIWLAISTDGGASFSAPQQVSEPLQDAKASWPEGPVVAVSDDQLYVSYGAHELGGAPYAIYVLQSDLPPLSSGPTPTAVDLALARSTRVQQPRSYHSINYPTLMVGPDGLGWLSVVASPVYTGEIWVAREGLGWAVENVTQTSPIEEPPCECCPPALGMDATGRVLVGWRGDIAKEVYVAETPDPSTPFGAHQQVSTTGISDLSCPQDGMEFVWIDEAMHLAWADARPSGSRGYLSREGSDGRWTHEPIVREPLTFQARVGAIATADGVLATWDTGWGLDSWFALAGETSGRPITVPGAGPLSEVRAIATGSGPVGLGIDSDGALWMVRLDTLAPPSATPATH